MNICKCSGKTIQGPLNLPFGHCQTKDIVSKKFFCYVDSKSACTDKQPSERELNLFFSKTACEFERACGISAADIDNDYDSYEYY